MNVPSKARLASSFACALAIALGIRVSGAPEPLQQRVPFVSCPSDGQAGYVAPPAGGPRLVSAEDVSIEQIAFYKGGTAPGAFAPRGWHCHVWYGSGAGVLLVTPEPWNDPAPGTAWPPKTSGQAIELVLHDSGASGRYEVAKFALLFFPRTAEDFIKSVNELGIVSISQASLRPYAKDLVTTIDDTMAEFVTPSNSEGFGTEQYLRPSSEPISGIAFLDQSKFGPNFVALRVRLNETTSQLKSSLLRLNRECLAERQGCSTR